MLNRIDEDLKTALKNKDKFVLSVLRMLKSEFINESRKGSLHELSDEEVLKVIKHQVKVRKDSKAEFEKYGKTESVADLEKEIDILNKYLPEEMNEEQINAVVDQVFDELNPTSVKDMGMVMKRLNELITNADMSLVSKIVRDRLN